MEWNVIYHNVNSDKIERFNIFRHIGFKTDIKSYAKQYKSKEEFGEKLKRSLQYHYWSKSEWEVIVTSWPPHIDMSELGRLNTERDKSIKDYSREPYRLYVNLDMGEKIDIYDQVMNNWSIFLDYVWCHKDELLSEKSENKES